MDRILQDGNCDYHSLVWNELEWNHILETQLYVHPVSRTYDDRNQVVQILLLSVFLPQHVYHERVHVYAVADNDMAFDNVDLVEGNADVVGTYKVVVDTLNSPLRLTNRNIWFFVFLLFLDMDNMAVVVGNTA